MSTSESVRTDIPIEYQKPEGLRTLANWLRSRVKVRNAVEHEKRVEYFKGKRLIDCLLDKNKKKWPKSIPEFGEKDKGIALLVAEELVRKNFFHRSEKVEDRKGMLRVSQRNVFEEGGYFTWMYAGDTTWSNIATVALVAIVIICTLLPIWPDWAKKILWYCSVTFLIGMLSFCSIRFVLFLFMWILGYEFWVFPRLFDETLSFQDSFKPIISFEKGKPGEGYYRIGLVIALAGFVAWACTQPTEFDGFIQAQRHFLDDLYSGNLLADVAQEAKDNIDKAKRVPNLEELLREVEEEERREREMASTFDGEQEAVDVDELLRGELDQDALDEARLEELSKKEENDGKTEGEI